MLQRKYELESLKVALRYGLCYDVSLSMTNIMIKPRMMNSSILFPLSSPNEIPQCKSDKTCNESNHIYIHWFVPCATFMLIEYLFT